MWFFWEVRGEKLSALSINGATNPYLLALLESNESIDVTVPSLVPDKQ